MRRFGHLAGIALLLTSLGTLPPLARGKDAAEPNPCAGATTDIENTNCRADQANAAEARLATLYRRVEKAIKAKAAGAGALRGYQERALAKLKAAQLAWRRYRDSECAAEEQQNEGGTIAASILSGCIKDLADRRVDELKKTYAIYLLPQ